MGLLDKVRNVLGIEVVQEPEEESAETQEQQQEPQKVQAIRPAVQPQPVVREERRGRTLNMPQPSSDRAQVVLVKPESFEDAPSIADHLCARHTVVLNLEATDREVTRRLVDFLSGVAYANKGVLRRVAKQTFLITPSDIDMLGELVDEVESTGLY